MRTWTHFPLWLALVLSLAGSAAAQTASDTTRIVVLPFNVSEGAEVYVFGLAAALQRSLNTVDGWYVPPVGDAALLSGRVQAAGLDVSDTLLDLFDADVIVSGQVRGGERPAVNLFFVGPGAGEAQATAVAADSRPVSLVEAATDAVLAALGKNPSASERQELDRMVAQTPSLPSLGVVSISTAALPGTSSADLAIAAELDPGSSWVRAEYARALLRDGQIEEALFAAQQATELLGSDPEAWTVYGVALLAADRIDEAVTAYERALQLNPSHALARAGLGNALVDGAALDAAVTIYPRLVDAWLSRAAAETDLSRSLQILRRAARYLPESVRLHRSAMTRAISAGDPAGAVTYLRAALATPLGASPALYALAADLPAGQLEAARELVQEGLARFPDDALLLRTAGEIDLRAGDLDAARARLEPLNARSPNDPETASLLALVLARQGDIDSALAVLGAVAGDSESVRLNFAVLLLEDGRSTQALEILEPAAAASDDPRIETYYALALSRTGRRQEADQILQRVIDANPDFALAQRAQSLLQQQDELAGENAITFAGATGEAFDRGLFALQNNDVTAAQTAFAEARELEDHPLIAFYQGYALQLGGRPREAIPAYEQALEGFPDSSTMRNNYGYAFLQTGRYDRALTELRTAVSLDDGNARAHLNLGLVYYQLGRFGEAIDAWNRAVAILPALEDEIADLRRRAENNGQP